MCSLFTRVAVRAKYGYGQEYNANSPGNQPFRQNFATAGIVQFDIVKIVSAFAKQLH